MTIYQAMQLNVKNLKLTINEATSKKDKYRYILALILRNITCLIFCILFISFFNKFFGQENSSVAITGLLAVLAFRFTDLDYDVNQSCLALLASFAICTIAPHIANLAPGLVGLIINFIALLTILVLTSHQVSYANHFSFVLGYILLWGNDVSGYSYTNRLVATTVAGIICVGVYYHCHHKKEFNNSIKTILDDFFTLSNRTCWYLKLSSAIALVFYLGELLHFSRTMWIAFACMSIINIDYKQIVFKLKYRSAFVIVGSVVFALLFTFIPHEYLGIASIAGGLLVGFSGSYHWQTAFNCFGALAITVDLFGLVNAVAIRIIANITGSIFSFVYHHLFDKFLQISSSNELIIENAE